MLLVKTSPQKEISPNKSKSSNHAVPDENGDEHDDEDMEEESLPPIK